MRPARQGSQDDPETPVCLVLPDPPGPQANRAHPGRQVPPENLESQENLARQCLPSLFERCDVAGVPASTAPPID